MAHDILGNMYASDRSAWHRLGYIDPALVSARVAIDKAGMNYSILKIPAMFTAPDGTQVESGVWGLVREPVAVDAVWRHLGTCGDGYDYWQNHEIADRVDMLSAQTGWKFTTCGVLERGATLFICLDMAQGSIAGEDVDRFFTFVERRNGLQSAKGFVSRIRTVCQNTLNLGIRSASSQMDIAHRAQFKVESDWMMNVISSAERAGHNIDAALNALAEIRIDHDSFSDMLNAAMPMPTMPRILTMPNLTGSMRARAEAAERVYATQSRKAELARDRIIANYAEINTEIDTNLRDTGWAAYQSVTQYTTHQHGTMLTGRGKRMTPQGRADWDLFGEGQRVRDAAYNSLIGN